MIGIIIDENDDNSGRPLSRFRLWEVPYHMKVYGPKSAHLPQDWYEMTLDAHHEKTVLNTLCF